MCKLYYYVQTTCYTASVAILTVISFERYVAIIHPMHSGRLHDIRLLVSVIVAVWMTAALSGLHYLVIFDTRHVPAAGGQGTVQFCLVVHHFNVHVYNVINLVMWYAAPLLVMIVIYVRISVELWRSSSSIISSSSNQATQQDIALQSTSAADIEATPDSPQSQRQRRLPASLACMKRRCSTENINNSMQRPISNPEVMSGRRKVIRLLIAVVGSFAVCVLPYHVRVIWQTFAQPQLDVDDWQLVIPPLTFVMYYLNSAVNPLLYAFLSQRFRSSLGDVLRGRCTQRSRTTVMTTGATPLATARTSPHPSRLVRTTPI